MLAVSNKLRATAVLLQLALGILDFVYGFLYAGGNYENIWYVMGGIYLFLAGITARDFQPLAFQPLILGYALFLLSAWAAAGVSRDPVAYVDKAVEVVLILNLGQLIRTTRHPLTAPALK